MGARLFDFVFLESSCGKSLGFMVERRGLWMIKALVKVFQCAIGFIFGWTGFVPVM
jgi:hypothetical protein